LGGNALIPACERGHIDTVTVLLTTKIDVNHVNNLGWTCLLEAVIATAVRAIAMSRSLS